MSSWIRISDVVKLRIGYLFVLLGLFSVTAGVSSGFTGDTTLLKKSGKAVKTEKNEVAANKKPAGKKGPEGSAKGARNSGALLSTAAIRKRFLLDKPVSEFTAADKRKIHLELENLLYRKTTQQFLSIIQTAEGGEPNIMVGDKPGCRVNNLKKHPGEVLPRKCFYYFYDKRKRLRFSTAAGNYQITRQNFRIFAPFLDLKDFEVPSQQLAALELVRRGGRKPAQVQHGFIAIVRGSVREAIRLGTPDWASFPGSDLRGNKRKDMEKIIQSEMRETIVKRTVAKLPAKRERNNKR